MTEPYFIVKGFMKNVKPLYEYAKNAQHNEQAILTDGQCLNTPSFYNDREMKKQHFKLYSKIEKLFKKKLFPTYCYHRVYKRGDAIKEHIDRAACEYSITLCLGYNKEPWPISIQSADGKITVAILKPGDALFYKGVDCKHWRDANTCNDVQAQLFLHYVEQDGPFAWAVGDLIEIAPQMET